MKYISKDEIPSFSMIYNKFRNNLFGPLYHLKKLERCVAQGSSSRIKRPASSLRLVRKTIGIAGK